MYLFPKVEFLIYIPKVSPTSRVRQLNSQLPILVSAALGWELDTLIPCWSIKGPKGSPRNYFFQIFCQVLSTSVSNFVRSCFIYRTVYCLDRLRSLRRR